MDRIALERPDSGRNSSPCNNKNSSIFSLEKKEIGQKIETRIGIRTYFHVSFFFLVLFYRENKVNRFSFLVDDTRVKLKDVDPDVPGADYINANYIRWKADESLGSSEMQSDPSGKVYIATQGQCFKNVA